MQEARESQPIVLEIKGGKGIESWIQRECSCGWIGSKHYAHNDYQHSNCREELARHLERHQAEALAQQG